MTKYCKCVYDYEAGDDDELTFAEGDVIEVLNDSDEGWWIGVLKGRKGTFPCNFVEVMPTEEARAALGLPSASDTTPKYSAPKRRSSLRSFPTQSTETARAEYDYTSQDDDELSFKEGDIVEIVTKFPGTEGWWQVKNAAGKVGLVPDNFFVINNPTRKASAHAINCVPPTVNESIEKASEANAAMAAISKAATTVRGNQPRSSSVISSLPSNGAPSPSSSAPPAATPDWRANLKKRNGPKPVASPAPEEKPEVPAWLKKRKLSLDEAEKTEKTEKTEKKEESAPAVPPPSTRSRKNSAATPAPLPGNGSPLKPPPAGSSLSFRRPKPSGKPGPGDGRPSSPVRACPPSKFNQQPSPIAKSEPSKPPPVPLEDTPPSNAASSSEAGALSAAGAEQLKKLSDMVLDLEKQVKSLTTSMKTMQGTIHNLESEVDAEKKLRGSCEVELQRIRQKLNAKEMDSI